MKAFFTTLSFLCLVSSSIAQVNSYTYSSYWDNYNELTSSTVLGSGISLDDNSFNAIDLGFPFVFNGSTYTQVSINSNGFLAMGPSVSSSYQAISNGNSNNIISAACANLQGNPNAILSYGLSGESGNHVFTVQWKDFRKYNSNGEFYNFQIRLLESGYAVELVYGDTHPVVTTAVQVGLRGNSTGDFNNRLTTNNWLATTSGTINSATCYLSVGSQPPTGWTFTYSPVTPGNPGIPFNPAPFVGSVSVPVATTLNWTLGDNTTSYDLWFGPSGSMFKILTDQPVSQQSCSFTVPLMNTGTKYLWKVVEHNGNGTLNGPVWSFTTVCGNRDIPFTENFDAYAPSGVGCGTILNVNNDAVKWETKTGSSFSGMNRLKIGYNPAGQPHNDWYVTPGLNLMGLQTYEVKFYYRGGSSIYFENLEVKWGTSPSVSGLNSPSIFSDVSFYKPNYILGTATFTPSSSGTYFIGWHCFSPGDQLGIDVDQITVDVVSACPIPTTLSVSSITSNSVQLGWSGTGSGYRIAYGPIGYSPGDATGILLTSTTTSLTISALTPSTNYVAYLQQDCGSGIYSGWSPPVEFTTLSTDSRTLTLKVFPEGLYTGSGMLNKVQGLSGDQFPGNTSDQINLELRNGVNGALVYSFNNADLNTSGIVTASIPAIYNGSYYIYVKHRNSITTSTAAPVSFSSNSIYYDFSQSIYNAFGANQKAIGGVAVIFSGDINQDGTIDASDMIEIDNDNTAFETGYLLTDIDGSGSVDATDMILVDNNNSQFTGSVLPF